MASATLLKVGRARAPLLCAPGPPTPQLEKFRIRTASSPLPFLVSSLALLVKPPGGFACVPGRLAGWQVTRKRRASKHSTTRYGGVQYTIHPACRSVTPTGNGPPRTGVAECTLARRGEAKRPSSYFRPSSRPSHVAMWPWTGLRSALASKQERGRRDSSTDRNGGKVETKSSRAVRTSHPIPSR